MLDLKKIRENQKEVEVNLSRRQDAKVIEDFKRLLLLDAEYRLLLKETDELRMKRNSLTEQIKVVKAQKKDASKLLEEAKKIPEKIKEKETEKNLVFEELQQVHFRVPNTLEETVPFGKGDQDNVEVRSWGNPKKNESILHHGQVAADLHLADFERAAKTSGTGFYFLKGGLALMEQALIQFALKKLVSKGFVFVSPPLLLKRAAYSGVTDLNDFENVMYKVENEDLYLIATSEHSLVSMHSDELIENKFLPLKYCGLSACFRREVGKRNIDERGLFRVHQFNKVEQVVYCLPQDSNKLLEELVNNAESLLKELEIPYRVVNVCTGDIGIVAAKKYDIEGYSPREGKYIELMSCSNCTSYQAVRSKIKYVAPNGDRDYLHTLNATMAAIPRILRIILEQNQTKNNSILVPKALQPFMNGLKELKKENLP